MCPNPCAATDGFLGADDDRLGPRRGEYDLTVYIFLRRPTKSSTDEVVVERVVVERASSTSSARRRRRARVVVVSVRGSFGDGRRDASVTSFETRAIDGRTSRRFVSRGDNFRAEFRGRVRSPGDAWMDGWMDGWLTGCVGHIEVPRFATVDRARRSNHRSRTIANAVQAWDAREGLGLPVNHPRRRRRRGNEAARPRTRTKSTFRAGASTSAWRTRNHRSRHASRRS